MTSHHIRPEWMRYATQSITRAEERDDARRDRAAAERDAALVALRAELVAVQLKVMAVHRTHANLIDALDGVEAAIADVDFERECGQ